jgi:hypothetical protein
VGPGCVSGRETGWEGLLRPLEPDLIFHQPGHFLAARNADRAERRL